MACTSCLITSDDGGESWQFGGVGPAGSRESQVAQVATTTTDAALYMNARNFGKTPGHRLTATCKHCGLPCHVTCGGHAAGVPGSAARQPHSPRFRVSNLIAFFAHECVLQPPFSFPLSSCCCG
jgi:hypothetical protein